MVASENEQSGTYAISRWDRRVHEAKEWLQWRAVALARSGVYRITPRDSGDVDSVDAGAAGVSARRPRDLFRGTRDRWLKVSADHVDIAEPDVLAALRAAAAGLGQAGRHFNRRIRADAGTSGLLLPCSTCPESPHALPTEPLPSTGTISKRAFGFSHSTPGFQERRWSN